MTARCCVMFEVAVCQHLGRALTPSMLFNLIAIEVEHGQPKRRRQVQVLALATNCCDEGEQTHVVGSGDFLESCPKFLFEPHAGLAAGNGNAPFDYRGFQKCTLPSLITARTRHHDRTPQTIRDFPEIRLGSSPLLSVILRRQ